MSQVRESKEVDPILVEIFGDTPNLRIMSFFIENPFDNFSLKEVIKYCGLSKEETKKWLKEFIEKKYIIYHRGYRTNRDSLTIEIIDKFIISK